MDRQALPTKPRLQGKRLINVMAKRLDPRAGPDRSTSPVPAAARAAASGVGVSRIAQGEELWGSGAAAPRPAGHGFNLTWQTAVFTVDSVSILPYPIVGHACRRTKTVSRTAYSAHFPKLPYFAYVLGTYPGHILRVGTATPRTRVDHGQTDFQ